MKEQEIEKVLKEIEMWLMSTCEGCAMPDKLNPLISKIRKLLEA